MLLPVLNPEPEAHCFHIVELWRSRGSGNAQAMTSGGTPEAVGDGGEARCS